jgi:hypothetical protein
MIRSTSTPRGWARRMPSGDSGRNESGFPVRLSFFFSPLALRASPRRVSTLQPGGGGAFPSPPTCTCDQPALPDSEGIKSKRECGAPVRTTLLYPFISAGFHFSRAERQARLVGRASRYCNSGGKFEKKNQIKIRQWHVHWLHSSSRTPIWPIYLVDILSLSPSHFQFVHDFAESFL